jgi:DNA polymerase-3 subunit epsilon
MTQEKGIVWFDLETTGINTVKDRIIEICMVKEIPGEETLTYKTLVQPDCGTKSHPEAQDKHGITEEDLIDAPTFKEIAKEVLEFIGDHDLGGYNVLYFDIPFLVEEFMKAGLIFNHRGKSVVDPFLIYSRYESRNLETAYTKYTGKTLEGAHRAEADIRATMEIFEKQKELYTNMPDNVEEIDKEVNKRDGRLDLSGKYKFASNPSTGKTEIMFNFGKYKGRPFKEVYEADKRYLQWMIDKGEFSIETKVITRKLIERMESETSPF